MRLPQLPCVWYRRIAEEVAFFLTSFVHIEEFINIMNPEIKGFPTSMLLHFGAPSLYIERETRKISMEDVIESFEKGLGCG